MKITNDLYSIIEESKKDKTKAYDTKAEVTRVEDSTLWVHIPGGVQETPIQKTVSASPGDVVQVRVSGGSAWVVGNASAPPTDDTTALVAKDEAAQAAKAAGAALQSADSARISAENATADAQRASTAAATADSKASAAATAAATADSKATAASSAASAAQSSADSAASAAATADSKAEAAASAAATADSKATAAGTAAAAAQTSADAAASAASSAQSDASAAATAAGQANTAANAAGVAASRAQAAADAAQGDIDEQREYFWHDATGAHVLSSADDTVTRYRTDIKGGGQEIVEIDTSGNETSVGTFGASGARLGQTGAAHSVIDSNGQRFYASDGTTELANIGYGETQGDGGQATAPYYSLGVRKSGTAKGSYSTAEGYRTTASRGYDHAEGGNTTAEGGYSHAEGKGTVASGVAAHAEGTETVASGNRSHAAGYGTIAAKQNQVAIGKYNIEDTGTQTSAQKAFIIGNGTDQNRSNAFSVDFSGNTEAAGDIWADGNIEADGHMNCNGDMSPAGNIVAGGEVEDGRGNVLSDKVDATSLAAVATSGSYSDLSNTPTIPTVNNATLTIKKNGTTVQTFTANSSTAKTADISVPTSTSDLTNDSGFISGTGFFKIVELEVKNSAQIAAHGYQTASTYTVPAASRPSGMVLVGVVGWGTTNYRLAPTTCNVNGAHSVTCNMCNTSATAVAANNTITLKLLYIKATSA